MKKTVIRILLIISLTLNALPSYVKAEEQPPASKSAEIVVSNDLDQTNTTNIDASTGENTAEAGNIGTKDATVSATVTTVVNTNIVGDNYLFEVNTINYDQTDRVSQSTSAQNVDSTSYTALDLDTARINNEASLQNVLNINADTGHNTATGEAVITTGNAQITANQVFVGNTTLFGDYWYFGIHNLSNTNQDLVLPNELNYLITGLAVNPSSAGVSGVETENAATNTTKADLTISTGSNQAGVNALIETGEITVSIDQREELNRTIIGDNWVIIQINKYDPGWRGSFGEWWGNLYEDDEKIIAWYFPGLTSTGQTNVNITNTATTITDIQVKANTGNNHADSKATINTGDITALINIFTKLNTTVIGSHWYLAVVNIFNGYTGNISLLRPGSHQPQPAGNQTPEISAANTGEMERVPVNTGSPLTIDSVSYLPNPFLQTGTVQSAATKNQQAPKKIGLVQRRQEPATPTAPLRSSSFPGGMLFSFGGIIGLVLLKHIRQ